MNNSHSLSNSTLFAGSPYSFAVCVAMVRPEVSARVAAMLAGQLAGMPDGAAREVLASRVQWWSLVAEAAAS